MVQYTLGIMFNETFDNVVLILKNRPDWQKNKFNFPGGKIESNESSFSCITREFNEECGTTTVNEDWRYIAQMSNSNIYKVDIYSAVYNKEKHGDIQTMEDQVVKWFHLNHLPNNRLSNTEWMMLFAKNYWQQGNIDKLFFGTFDYIGNDY